MPVEDKASSPDQAGISSVMAMARLARSHRSAPALDWSTLAIRAGSATEPSKIAFASVNGFAQAKILLSRT